MALLRYPDWHPSQAARRATRFEGQSSAERQAEDLGLLEKNRIGDGFVCLLFYVLATSKVISEQVPTCDSAHSW